jgi:hypothetical protein
MLRDNEWNNTSSIFKELTPDGINNFIKKLNTTTTKIYTNRNIDIVYDDILDNIKSIETIKNILNDNLVIFKRIKIEEVDFDENERNPVEILRCCNLATISILQYINSSIFIYTDVMNNIYDASLVE